MAMSAPYTKSPAGYRLPDELMLGRVRLQVANVARSVAYYQRVLGFRVLSNDGVNAKLGPANEDVVLVELNELAGAAPVPRRGRLGLYHFALLLPDRASLARFVQHLSDIGEYVGMADHYVSEAVYLTDPDGLGIEVYADRPRSTWAMSGPNLAMGTDPLNLHDLMPAAGDGKWAGMPAGTRVGHVHLYVGDLAEGEAFFHNGLGLDKILLAFPGALFLSAGGYHHHLGTNTWAASAPRTQPHDAQLLEWTVILPSSSVEEAARSIEAAGYPVERDGNDVLAADPWGTRVRITSVPDDMS
jgi:catechol 2,3-dioxygenase